MIRFLCSLALLLFVTPAHAATPICGTSDDTLQVQAAIDAAVASDGVVDLPVGFCQVTSLNLTEIQGLIFRGQGRDRSYLIPIQDGAIVMDLTGSLDVTLQDFQLGRFNDTATPAVGILTAQSDGNYLSNMLHFERIYVTGSYSIAAWYNLSVASSTVYASQFYNYANGIGTVVFVSDNWPGVQSPYVPISTVSVLVSDWSFFGVEIHNFSDTASAQAGGWVLWMGGARQIRFYGGNISGQSPDGWVSLNTTGGIETAFVIFDGVTFYSDNGIPATCAVTRNGTVNEVHFRANENTATRLLC